MVTIHMKLLKKILDCGKRFTGGIMVGDDYKRFEGVKKAVNESFEEFNVIQNTWFKKF